MSADATIKHNNLYRTVPQLNVIALLNGLKEARPPSATVKLSITAKQSLATACTLIHTFPLLSIQRGRPVKVMCYVMLCYTKCRSRVYCKLADVVQQYST
eukprot:6319-Heterococcus_DN1.PRE.4